MLSKRRTPPHICDMTARARVVLKRAVQEMERRCPDPSFSRFPQPGIRRRRSGAATATIFRPLPTRRRSTNYWKRFPRWRSICCRTIIPILLRNRCSCRSPRCAKPNRPQAEWRRSSIARCGICCAPPAARWSGRGAAATKSGTARLPNEISPCPSAFRADTPPMLSCVRPDCRKRSERARSRGVVRRARFRKDHAAG
jgi:hypothetical protein